MKKNFDDVQSAIADECDRVKAMLLAKNRKYGNSALDPVRIFSKAPPDEQLLVRMDDKVSRYLQGEGDDEDVLFDLLGYLVLYRVQRRLTEEHPQTNAEILRVGIAERLKHSDVPKAPEQIREEVLRAGIDARTAETIPPPASLGLDDAVATFGYVDAGEPS